MAYGMDDLVREQATFAGGTGAVTLTTTPVSGSQSFLSGWGASGTGEYKISIGAQWEVGFGTLNAGGTTLTRTDAEVYDGSSGPGARVNFSAGTMDCTGVVPAQLAHHLNMREITVADSGTPDIGTVRGLRVVCDGATTITSFGTAKNRLRFVRFSGARTLTHNATTLILPGAANITTVANDTAIFASDNSGNWRCLQYTVANLTPIDGAAWVQTTPTPTPAGGSFTATAKVRVKYYGKTVAVGVQVIITNVGTGTGSISVPLPFTTNAAMGGVLYGRDTALTGKMLVGNVSGGASAVTLTFYDSASAIAVTTLAVSGMLEIA